MCGICGVASLDNSAHDLTRPIMEMTSAMRHRGPDDEGYLFYSLKHDSLNYYAGADTPIESHPVRSAYIPSNVLNKNMINEAQVGFGHRRLSIIDLSINGHQPLCDTTSKYWIIYNGEIYNFKDVRKSLESLGHTFNTVTDTEVIVEAYKQWGVNCVKQFNGMFAFAILDLNARELVLFRDRVGIKPLYYTFQDKQLIFASDIKTIIASGLYHPDVNWEGLWYNLSLSMSPRPMTAFKDIFALEQGHWMRLSLENGQFEKRQYWQLPIGVQNMGMSEEDAVQLLEHHLDRAIKRRLIADVEVGTFMSGGIDSTLISSKANQMHQGIKAFTLGYEHLDDLNEIDQAKDTAQMWNMHHIIKMVDASRILDFIPDMVSCYEEPFGTLSPNYLLAQFVAENDIKVILNGLGGDELFCGYPYYKRMRQWKWARQAAWLLKLLPTRNSSRISTLKSMSESKDIASFYTAIKSHFLRNDNEKKKLFRLPESWDTSQILRDTYGPSPGKFTDDLEAINYYDIYHNIGNHHLHRLDQFTMHFSIEGRLPFLDHELIEASMTIPSRLKIKNGVQKYVLRKLAEKYIAPSNLAMRKRGFSLPLGQWLKYELKDFSKNTLDRLKQREMINEAYVDDTFRAMRVKNFSKVWQLVMLELWFQRFID